MKVKIVVTAAMLILISSAGFVSAQDKMVFSGVKGSAYSALSERLVKVIYKSIGIDASIIEYPGKRALKISNSGEIDGELYRIPGANKIYTNLMMIPTPHGYLEGMAYTKIKKIPAVSWENISAYRIGARLGILWSDKPTEKMNRIMISSYKQLFDMMDKGRVDIVLIAHFNTLKLFQKSPFTGVDILYPPLSRIPLHHYPHKKNKSLIPRIDAAIQSLIKDGTIQKITDQYIEEISRK